MQPHEQIAQEHHEDEEADEPRLDDQRDVERVRPPVRLPGDELVVDGEVVQPEPEQRVRVEDLRDEVVDREVRRRRRAAGLDARAQDDGEVVPARVDDVQEHGRDDAERHEQRARPREAAVRQREHEQPDAEPEQAAARERRELDDEQEREHAAERPLQPVPALEPQVHRRQGEQRDLEHDPEVVRVAGERVRPVDALPVHRAVDVDRARAAGERREQRRGRGCGRPARRAAAARRRPRSRRSPP